MIPTDIGAKLYVNNMTATLQLFVESFESISNQTFLIFLTDQGKKKLLTTDDRGPNLILYSSDYQPLRPHLHLWPIYTCDNESPILQFGAFSILN